MIKPKDLRIGDFVKVSSDHSMIPQGTICEVVGISYERILTKKKSLALLKLKYVHQLQHLLFGLGLDSNFDLTDTKKGE